MVFLKEVSGSWNEFEKFVVFGTSRLKDKVNFYIREFLAISYFPSDFTVVAKKF